MTNYVQESNFSPYRGMVIFNKRTSHSDYIVNGIYWLIRNFLEVIEYPKFLNTLNFNFLNKYQTIFF